MKPELFQEVIINRDFPEFNIAKGDVAILNDFVTENYSGVKPILKKKPTMPDPSVDRRLLDNMRQARLSFEEVDLQVEELISKFDELIRQQKLKRIQQKQKT